MTWADKLLNDYGRRMTEKETRRGRFRVCAICGWGGREELWVSTTQGFVLEGFQTWCPVCGTRFPFKLSS